MLQPCSMISMMFTFLFSWSSITASLIPITEAPVSVTALVGANAEFSCAGAGIAVLWEIDGLSVYDPIIAGRGITSVIRAYSGTVHSNLTVPATSVNNGTTVLCKIFTSSGFTVSNKSILTVLPGIGHVLNLRFNPSFTTILWDPPLSTAGLMSSLYYQVTVMNIDSGVIFINTTTNSYYTLPDIQLCEYYTANVTVSSSGYHGDGVVFGQVTPGDYYNVEVIKQEVAFNSKSSVKLIITQNLTLPGILLPCSSQRLTFQTYPQSNFSVVTTHPHHVIEETGYVVYPITAGIERKYLYTVVIGVAGNKGVVKGLELNFSTFDVQHCDVHTDNASILVECTFATNSTALGFVLVRDEHSRYTINATLQRHESDKGSVKINDLPAGVYSVSVYDQLEDTNPACTHSNEQIVPPHIEPAITIPPSTNVLANISAESETYLVYTPSMVQSTTQMQTDVFIAVSIPGGILLLFVVLLVTIMMLLLIRMRPKKDLTVTEPIPVDDNPVYITMKRIHMNKNSAYDVVHI